MKKFAIFILSHNRADKIDTLKLLKESNYKGDWFVVISTDNKEIDKYEKIIGKKHLLIFDKQMILCDTMLSRRNFCPHSSLYARNFIVDYARTRYKFFGMVDDDISNIYFRFNVDGHMKMIDCKKHLNEICSSICDFLNDCEMIGGVCFKNNGGYFGGVLALKKIDRELQQFMFLKSKDVRFFSGLYLDDAILSCSNFDKLYFALTVISAKSPKLGSNSGGISYNSMKYPPNLFWYIYYPSAVKVKGINAGRVRYNKYMYPKILNVKYKKL